jgi:probable rRNA maturation factor
VAPDVHVAVLNRQRSRRIALSGLQRFMRRIVEDLPPERSGELSVCLVSDRCIREYNRTFRGHDTTTDVLAFPGDAQRDPEGRVYLGDIAISVPTAAQQARALGHSLSRELKILALHGYLHLLGYDHERDKGQMLRLQRRLQRRLLPASPKRRGVG